ncbi:hypothetical protein H4R27_001887 [Coemansia aciculifera]|uniref:Uncharacterized protein n=1 Tax=Coemansia pectinata TaxID=1052879 RepID=A0A9W8GZE5_9FUNG|nr:hypothetical protein GGI19_000460 [Coemansia pectinata]KAJ2884726.1 hypothetical protein H4R27_001887 [Coemansia aciculifera]
MAHGFIDSLKEKVESTIHKASRRLSHENEQQGKDATGTNKDTAPQSQGQQGEQISHEQQGAKDMAQQGQQQASSMGQSAADQARSQIPGQAQSQMPQPPNPTQSGGPYGQ